MKKLFNTVILSIFIFCSSVFAEEYARPCGEIIGIKMYTDGLLVIDKDKNVKGIKLGDRLLSANGKQLNTIEDLTSLDYGNEIKFEINRNGKIITEDIIPMSDSNGKKLGLWLRDSTAGVGTLTYITNDNTTFAALGHGITDVDTGNILTLKSGNILNCTNISCTKSKKGQIGEINASFENTAIGSISANSPSGIYGSIKFSKEYDALPIADINEIHTGDAYIMCNIGNGVEKYNIKIEKIFPEAVDDKAMVIEITDNRLLAATGGIVQGMSGSPIIQNERLVGAVTHVFVNNPVKGYGIFIKSMMK